MWDTDKPKETKTRYDERPFEIIIRLYQITWLITKERDVLENIRTRMPVKWKIEKVEEGSRLIQSNHPKISWENRET